MDSTSLIIGIVVGIVVLLICIIPCIIGLNRQLKSRSFDPVLYGELPTAAIVMHCIFTACMVIGCILFGITIYFPIPLYVGIAVYLIKLCVVGCGSREAGAFKNSRNAQETAVFLESLRQKTPVISIHVRCWHTEYYYDSQGHRQSRTVTTFTETRYIGITSWYDKTPAMYVNGNAALVYLKLQKSINFIGQSSMILEWHRQNAYNQNRYRDTNCSATVNTCIPGLTEDNFLRMGIVPQWMNSTLFGWSNALCFDVCFVCTLRAFVPSTRLSVIKYISLEPVGIPYQQMQLYADPIQPPNPSQINSEPLTSQIRPPDFQINTNEVPVQNTVQHQVMQGTVMMPTQQQYQM